MIANSGIGFGGNRVAKMEIIGVKIYNDKGKKLYENTSSQVIFQ